MTTPVVTGLDAELARLGVTGAVRVATLGTTIPTTMAAWGAGWENCGYISDDGLTESNGQSRATFTPWQGRSPIRTEITEDTTTFQATFWESNWQTVSLYYGVGLDDVTVTGTGDTTLVVFDTGNPRQDARMFGFDVLDGVYARRMIVPYGEVTEKGDLTYKSDTLIGYPVTMTAYKGPDGYSVRRMFMEGWAPPAETP